MQVAGTRGPLLEAALRINLLNDPIEQQQLAIRLLEGVVDETASNPVARTIAGIAVASSLFVVARPAFASAATQPLPVQSIDLDAAYTTPLSLHTGTVSEVNSTTSRAIAQPEHITLPGIKQTQRAPVRASKPVQSIVTVSAHSTDTAPLLLDTPNTILPTLDLAPIQSVVITPEVAAPSISLDSLPVAPSIKLNPVKLPSTSLSSLKLAASSINVQQPEVQPATNNFDAIATLHMDAVELPILALPNLQPVEAPVIAPVVAPLVLKPTPAIEAQAKTNTVSPAIKLTSIDLNHSIRTAASIQTTASSNPVGQTLWNTALYYANNPNAYLQLTGNEHSDPTDCAVAVANFVHQVNYGYQQFDPSFPNGSTGLEMPYLEQDTAQWQHVYPTSANTIPVGDIAIAEGGPGGGHTYVTGPNGEAVAASLYGHAPQLGNSYLSDGTRTFSFFSPIDTSPLAVSSVESPTPLTPNGGAVVTTPTAITAGPARQKFSTAPETKVAHSVAPEISPTAQAEALLPSMWAPNNFVSIADTVDLTTPQIVLTTTPPTSTPSTNIINTGIGTGTTTPESSSAPDIASTVVSAPQLALNGLVASMPPTSTAAQTTSSVTPFVTSPEAAGNTSSSNTPTTQSITPVSLPIINAIPTFTDPINLSSGASSMPATSGATTTPMPTTSTPVTHRYKSPVHIPSQTTTPAPAAAPATSTNSSQLPAAVPQPADINATPIPPADFPLIMQAATVPGADPAITPAFVAALLDTEAHFNDTETSQGTSDASGGAEGVGQWLPQYFDAYSPGTSQPNNPWNIKDAIPATIKYLDTNAALARERFGATSQLDVQNDAAAMYNGGEGQFIAAGGIPSGQPAGYVVKVQSVLPSYNVMIPQMLASLNPVQAAPTPAPTPKPVSKPVTHHHTPVKYKVQATPPSTSSNSNHGSSNGNNDGQSSTPILTGVIANPLNFQPVANVVSTAPTYAQGGSSQQNNGSNGSSTNDSASSGTEGSSSSSNSSNGTSSNTGIPQQSQGSQGSQSNGNGGNSQANGNSSGSNNNGQSVYNNSFTGLAPINSDFSQFQLSTH